MVSMCRVLRVHRSGFYAWIQTPQSARSKEDLRLLQLIRTAYDESGNIYGSPAYKMTYGKRGAVRQEACGEDHASAQDQN